MGVIRDSKRSRTLTLDDFDRAVTDMHEQYKRLVRVWTDDTDSYVDGYRNALADLLFALGIPRKDWE